jgi:threonine/homoserine/homoserine lactone efflux protein
MDLTLLARGLVIGFSIAAPVGPIGVLCIRRTLAEGRIFGLISGVGAASADAVYGSIAGFGLTTISGALVSGQTIFRLFGGAFLVYLGVRTWRAQPTPMTPNAMSPDAHDGHSRSADAGRLLGAYTSTFALTLTNPATILSFAAIYAGLGIAETGADYAAALMLVAGVFGGSAAWWLLLSGGVSLLRGTFTPARLRWINRLSGVVLAGFGLLALASAAL